MSGAYATRSKRLPESSALAASLDELHSSLETGEDVILAPRRTRPPHEKWHTALQVSRATVYKLIKAGDLHVRMVSTHKRIGSRSVFDYTARQRAARRELTETFAHADANERELVNELAAVDEETARRLGLRHLLLLPSPPRDRRQHPASNPHGFVAHLTPRL